MIKLLDLGLWQNILASFLWAAALAAPGVIRRFQPRNLRWLHVFYGVVFIVVIMANALAVDSVLTFRIFGLALTSLFLYLVYRELRKFWQLGLVRADRRVKDGIDYSKALALTKNELWFLGLGASKLTSDAGFAEAIRRCNRDGTSSVRFLLVDPESETDTDILATAERRAEKQRGTYRDRVRESLKTIESLRAREFNIDVRLYRGSLFNPVLRLMFVDDTICLVSHYVLGEGDGSQLPQLCLLNPRHFDERTAGSFYGAFRRVFESCWREGIPWNSEGKVK